MKNKTLCVFIAAAVIALSACSAFGEGVRLGMLSLARETVRNLGDAEISRTALWNVGNIAGHAQGTSYHFYDNLVGMMIALNAGDIDEILAPQFVAEYMVNVNPEYAISCAIRVGGYHLALGFREKDGEELRNKFNAALAEMRKYGTLDALTQMYCTNPGKDNIAAVRFTEFPGAETLRVAVTGDLPPLDYVGADGEPAGYNTAILAELGRRLKVNIKPVHVDTAARTAALMSGRVDAVFWYQFIKGAEVQQDAPEGVIFSEPYRDSNVFLHVRKK